MVGPEDNSHRYGLCRIDGNRSNRNLTFAIGVAFFGDPAGFMRVFSFLLIVAGVIGLKHAG